MTPEQPRAARRTRSAPETPPGRQGQQRARPEQRTQPPDPEEHPLNAYRQRLVRDEHTGLTGVLQDVCAYQEFGAPQGPRPARAQLLAFIRPQGGGREWTADPAQVTVVERAGEGTL